MTSKARYEGLADWYDESFAGYAEGETSSAAHLARLLGEGKGWCLDVACGTGIHFPAILSTGRQIVGVDISADQLRLARSRAATLIRADAAKLPIRDESFDTVTCAYLHSDIDEMAPVFAEICRVLRPGGRLVYLGTHPCFIGPFVELREDYAKVIHPGYRDAGWHHESPFVRGQGCTR